ncbi:MAG: DUF1565 domain-containing protein, partial [Betaproteobacteria bacterium]
MTVRHTFLRDKRIFAGAAALLLQAMSIASATTYHVAVTGNDNAQGTQSRPWRTLQRAANSANPGDAILVATGVYREKLAFVRGGSPDKKIMFKNSPGQFPVIDGQGLEIGKWGALVSFNNVGHVRLEGFEIRNSGAYNVSVSGESHHLEIVALKVHDGAYSGIWMEGPEHRPAMSVIYGNQVYNHKGGGITLWTSGGGYYRIDSNEVWGNAGTGNYDG